MWGDKADTWVPLPLELGSGPWSQGPRGIAQTGPGSESQAPQGRGQELKMRAQRKKGPGVCPAQSHSLGGRAESTDRAGSLAGEGESNYRFCSVPHKGYNTVAFW